MINKVLVNPMKGWGNMPQIIVVTNAVTYNPNWIYTNTADCYWYQGKDGITDFLFHTFFDTFILKDTDHYESDRWSGFGGRTFPIKLQRDNKIIRVDLHGPWSGDSYCANKYLPKPSIGVSYKKTKEKYATIAGHMTWESLSPHLPSGFEIGDKPHSQGHWPEIKYQEKYKEEWDKNLIDKLHEDYVNSL